MVSSSEGGMYNKSALKQCIYENIWNMGDEVSGHIRIIYEGISRRLVIMLGRTYISDA